MKKRICIGIVLLTLLLQAGCGGSSRREEAAEAERISRMEGFLAMWLHFENNFVEVEAGWSRHTEGRELVLVHSAEEAEQFSWQTTVVLWPSLVSHGIVDAMNQYIEEEDFDLEPFAPLTHPLAWDD